MEASDLSVEYCGELYEVQPGDNLTFGRSADLSLDDNPYMHRVAGRIESRAGRWWLANVGSSAVIELYDRGTRSKAIVMPGTDQALPGADVVVRFSAGETSYEIDIRTDQERFAPEQIEDLESPETLLRVVPLTDSQLALVLSLAEPILLDPLAKIGVPPSKQAAKRLGWSMSKFNRKLDNVCDKFGREGVRGLKARSGGLSRDRRQRLVDHCVSAGVVDASMLTLLDEQQS